MQVVFLQQLDNDLYSMSCAACGDAHHFTPEFLGCYETHNVTCDCGYTFTVQMIPAPTPEILGN